MMELVSIVIPARNEEKFLPECLASIQTQTYPHRLLEIIVVNSASEDNTENIAEEFSRNSDIAVKILQNPRGDTPRALNIGYKNASGDLILHLIAHATIEPDHIERAVKILHEKNADGVCGKILTIGSGLDTFWDYGISAAMESFFGLGNVRARLSSKPGWLDNPMLALYRKELFEKFGYIDERLTRNQDYEFHQRCFAGGAKFWFEPSLKVYYRNRPNIKQLWRQYFNAAKWRTFMLGEHYGAVHLRHLVPSTFVLTLFISIIVGIFWRPALFFFLFIAALYLSLIFVNTIYNVISRKKLSILISLPIAFITIHFAYGIGFLVGLFHFFILGGKNRVFSAEKQYH